MISRTISLALGCVALCGTTALGQTPAAPKDVDVFFTTTQVPGTDLFRYQLLSAGPSDSATTAEDIEIFRRILDKTLEPWTSFLAWMTPVYQTGATGQPQPLFGGSNSFANHFGAGLSGNTGGGFSGFNPGQFSGNTGGGFSGNTSNWFSGNTQWPRYTLLEHPSQKAEGVYLPGYGVIFTVTLPWDGQDPMGKTTTAEPKSISEWDRVRKEMRGEKVPEHKEQTKKSPSLVDSILKVLAENGHHFTSLTTNERVTVAITLRPSMGASSANVRYYKNLSGNVVDLGDFSNKTNRPSKPAQPNDAHAAHRSEAANLVNLGNQRLAQKRNDDAIDAYRKAIELYQLILDSYRPDGSNIQNQLSDVASAADVWSRLAKVYVAAGKKAEAEKIMQNIARAYEKVAKPVESDSGSSSSESKIPAKLIISATKPVLDRMGTGKMSLSDFRGEAKIEYFPLPHEGKVTGKVKNSKP